jgi:mannose-1-phosphate guanylyltransferase/mannose-6-phosphate isomerase
MIIVIIAGGSGTRLWPLSTPDYPKHLLKVNDDDRSLLQHSYDRAKHVTDNVYVVSEAGHISHVKEQLPDLPEGNFIIEPARRGTANCITAALAYISKLHDNDEPIASVHADHFIRDTNGYSNCLIGAGEASKTEKRIVLVGVEPTYPATHLGYIQKDEVLDDKAFVYNVHSFKEKPDFETAKEYVDSGNYLWNCGYFVGSINTFVNTMKQFAPELYESYKKLVDSTKEEYENVYLSLTNEAIDYALIEKVPNLLVVPATFDWMDVGSFNDLHKAIGGDENGNYIQGYVEIDEVQNAYIQNYEEKPVAVIGLDNIVVINTENGILVARKDLAQNVGNVSKRLKK